MAPDSDPAELHEQPIGELLKRLADETSTLVRQELELAKAEVSEKGKRMGVGAGLLSGAGLTALLALGALTAAIVLALDTAMASWLAALIVAAVYGAVAGVMALIGRSRIRDAAPPVPEQTVETVKEDVRWVKTRARSGSR
jgi:uncharacterized membrane protein YqjE